MRAHAPLRGLGVVPLREEAVHDRPRAGDVGAEGAEREIVFVMKKQSAAREKPTAAAQEPKPPANEFASTGPDGSITYYGIVTDFVTDKPIPDVKVSVWRRLSRDPKTGGWTSLETTEHETDALGRYSFLIPPEQAAQEKTP